ncbi:MAG: hypothetical protein GKR90_25955 [Pseudomonadales bacterium]|nr:hypothetical protein [Pseudomonadales bacterium]
MNLKRITLLLIACLTAPTIYADAVGVWDVTTTTKRADLKTELHIELQDGAFKATVTPPQRGKASVDNFKVDGDKIEFTLLRSIRGRSFSFDHAGTIEGDKFSGEAKTAKGKLIPFEGIRR